MILTRLPCLRNWWSGKIKIEMDDLEITFHRTRWTVGKFCARDRIDGKEFEDALIAERDVASTRAQLLVT